MSEARGFQSPLDSRQEFIADIYVRSRRNIEAWMLCQPGRPLDLPPSAVPCQHERDRNHLLGTGIHLVI